jgi:hypothetical protein
MLKLIEKSKLPFKVYKINDKALILEGRKIDFAYVYECEKRGFRVYKNCSIRRKENETLDKDT